MEVDADIPGPGEIDPGQQGEITDPLEKLQVVVRDILNDVVDNFQVMELAKTLAVNLSKVSSFAMKKLLIIEQVIEQILKFGPSNRPYYERILEETRGTIRCSVRKSKKYVCCMIGCLFTADDHRSYIQHVKTFHHTHDNFICNFKHKCNRHFVSLNELMNHIKRSHTKGVIEVTNEVAEDVECRCVISSCYGRKFRSVSLLMTHVNTVHSNEERDCIFEKCSTRFKAGSNSRHHFRIKHKQTGILKLKEKYVVVTVRESGLGPSNAPEIPTVEEDEPDNETEIEDELYNEDNCFEDEESPPNDIDAIARRSNFFMMQYADFLNRLTHMKFIPQSNVTDIANEYRLNSEKAVEVRENKLKVALSKVPGITEKQIDTILLESVLDDDYLKAQVELNTEFKRKRFIQENFKYVAPMELLLNEREFKAGGPKDVVHYIPVKESLKNLLEDRSLIEVLETEKEKEKKNDEVLRDFRDGFAFKDNDYFQNNPGAFAAHFYSDAVELTNPLGAAKGRHKIVQVFYSLCQIPKLQRSQIDRIQLCMVFKEKLLKKHGYKKIFSNLMNDLKDLETGLIINYPSERKIQMGVLAYSADNLEAHSLGGFSCCFSSKDVCRFCHCQYSDLLSHIHDYDGDEMHHYWSKEEYDRICASIEAVVEDDIEEPGVIDSIVRDELERSGDDEVLLEDGDITNECDDETAKEFDYQVSNESENEEELEEDVEEEEGDAAVSNLGLKHRCVFNQLQSFHATISFPPDCMHDVLEGVAAQDLCAGIKVLCLKRWFSLEDYNRKLKTLGYPSYESSDIPEPIHKHSKKLSGKACSIWVHARNFPLIVKGFMSINGDLSCDDQVLHWLLTLISIIGRLSAREFRNHEIEALETEIIDYLDLRKEIYVQYPTLLGTPKPKHHLLTHYGQAVRLFGPPLTYWTGRFER